MKDVRLRAAALTCTLISSSCGARVYGDPTLATSYRLSQMTTFIHKPLVAAAVSGEQLLTTDGRDISSMTTGPFTEVEAAALSRMTGRRPSPVRLLDGGSGRRIYFSVTYVDDVERLAEFEFLPGEAGDHLALHPGLVSVDLRGYGAFSATDEDHIVLAADDHLLELNGSSLVRHDFAERLSFTNDPRVCLLGDHSAVVLTGAGGVLLHSKVPAGALPPFSTIASPTGHAGLVTMTCNPTDGITVLFADGLARMSTRGEWTDLKFDPPLASAGPGAFEHALLGVMPDGTLFLVSEAAGVYRALPQ
jgi:hypothetical protein